MAKKDLTTLNKISASQRLPLAIELRQLVLFLSLTRPVTLFNSRVAKIDSAWNYLPVRVRHLVYEALASPGASQLAQLDCNAQRWPVQLESSIRLLRA